MKFYPLIASLFVCSSLLASPPSTREQMKSSLDHISLSLDLYYAPAAWKKEWCGWDQYYELSKAKNKIDASPALSLKDYQVIVRDFLASTRDYHVSVRFHSTETAILPLKIKGAEGRYFISWINRSRLSENSFPFHEGDEITHFDGVSIKDYLKKFQSEEFSLNVASTDEKLAEKFLTLRSGSHGHTVPSGYATLRIKKQTAGKETEAVRINWIYTAEKITPPYQLLSKTAQIVTSAKSKKSEATLASKFPQFCMHKNYMTPISEELSMDHDDLGSRESFVPELGTKIWESDPSCTFHAYIFKDNRGKNMGYVRISDYMGGHRDVEEFKDVINVLELNTEGLVIDQLNNPGGSIFYLYTLASMLTDKPLHTPSQRITITQYDVAEALDLIELLDDVQNFNVDRRLLSEMFDGYPATDDVINKMRATFENIINEWSSGRFYTNNLYVYGIDQITPHETTRYTKPILMLINELDFSGGDFLPAILQDNKRVTLLGARTAGAGGYLMKINFPNRLGIKSFQITGSIAERSNLKPIENLGVEPDIKVNLKAEDLTSQYTRYKKTILKELIKLTP